MNNGIKKFLVRLALLLAGVASAFVVLVLSGIFVIGNQHEQMYGGALTDKAARMRSIYEPKIIITGDSSVAFGINSPMIQEAMNMPVVNLGLNVGLGNFLLENAARISLNSGDILIACPTNFSGGGNIVNITSAWLTIENNFEFWQFVSPQDYFIMGAAYPLYWFKSFCRWITRRGDDPGPQVQMRRSSFNGYGDVVVKPESERMPANKMFRSKAKVPEIGEAFIAQTNDFNAYVRSRGATLLIAGYPIAYGEYTPPAEEYEAFSQKLAQSLDCAVISSYRDYFIPYQYFYDTGLHLDNEGAKIRTAQLIKDLKNWQANR